MGLEEIHLELARFGTTSPFQGRVRFEIDERASPTPDAIGRSLKRLAQARTTEAEQPERAPPARRETGHTLLRFKEVGI